MTQAGGAPTAAPRRTLASLVSPSRYSERFIFYFIAIHHAFLIYIQASASIDTFTSTLLE